MSWTPSSSGTRSQAGARQAVIHHATPHQAARHDGYPALKESYRSSSTGRPSSTRHLPLRRQMTRGDFSGLLRRMAKDKITVVHGGHRQDATCP